MKKTEFLIDTDVLLDHLFHADDSPSALEILMTKGLCFTTVLNASELIFNVPQKLLAVDLLNAIKVLGIHPKYALGVDKYKIILNTLDEAVFCATAEYNKLPIVTFNKGKYIPTGLKILTPKEIDETL